MQLREKWQSERSRTKSEMAAKKNRNENTACMMLMIRPRCTTKCVSRAERRYALRPCHSRHRVACENCASDTSAASEACCPSCAGFERGRVHTSAGKILMLGTGFRYLGTVLRKTEDAPTKNGHLHAASGLRFDNARAPCRQCPNRRRRRESSTRRCRRRRSPRNACRPNTAARDSPPVWEARGRQRRTDRGEDSHQKSGEK